MPTGTQAVAFPTNVTIGTEEVPVADNNDRFDDEKVALAMARTEINRIKGVTGYGTVTVPPVNGQGGITGTEAVVTAVDDG